MRKLLSLLTMTLITASVDQRSAAVAGLNRSGNLHHVLFSFGPESALMIPVVTLAFDVSSP
jgi:hypothetical protein